MASIEKKAKNPNTELKANLKDVFKTVLVLALIAIVSGGLLGGINAVTKISEDELLAKKLVKVYEADSFVNLATTTDENYNKENAIIAKLNEGKNDNTKSLALLPVKGGKVVDDTVIYRVYGAGNYDCTLLVLVENDMISKVAVYSSSATPGIGDKAYADKFINQFKNINLLTAKPFVLEKGDEDNQIDTVTGATKSSNAVKDAINTAMALHKALWGDK